MEIKIVVDETKFKDVIEKELEAFSKDELHDIIRDCIIDSLRNNDVLKNLFVTTKQDGYYNIIKNVPGEVVLEAAKHIDLSPAFEEVQENMIKELRENYKTILEKVMLNMIIMGMANNYDFQHRMADEIQCIFNNRNNH